jgi:hypothetical protein
MILFNLEEYSEVEGNASEEIPGKVERGRA